MNYRHIYHAGSFTDVFKHCVLTALLQALQRKDTPFCFLDTHAGIGIYNLQSDAARKTREFTGGISLLLNKKNPPPVVSDFLKCVKSFNQAETSLVNYPGSPNIAKYFLRPNDRIVLSELHPYDGQALQKAFWGDKQVAVHHQDGYQALKAFLPPKERRGLVLIDPPYENPDEFAHILAGLEMALARWETGIYAVWYPLKDAQQTLRFKKGLEKLPYKNILIAELSIYPEDNTARLNGSGMAIINAPWQVDKEIRALTSWLWDILSVNKLGKYSVNLYERS